MPSTLVFLVKYNLFDLTEMPDRCEHHNTQIAYLQTGANNVPGGEQQEVRVPLVGDDTRLPTRQEPEDEHQVSSAAVDVLEHHQRGSEQRGVATVQQITVTNENLNNENELRRAYNRQTDELRVLKKQRANSEKRVKELEEQITRLQNK